MKLFKRRGRGAVIGGGPTGSGGSETIPETVYPDIATMPSRYDQLLQDTMASLAMSESTEHPESDIDGE